MFVEKIKTRILSSLFFEKHALCEIMWKNSVERDRTQKTILRMRIACWIPKAIDTRSLYVVLVAFPLQQCLPESARCYVISTLPVCVCVCVCVFFFIVTAVLKHFCSG